MRLSMLNSGRLHFATLERSRAHQSVFGQGVSNIDAKSGDRQKTRGQEASLNGIMRG